MQLHVTNGDSTAEPLRQSGLPGEVVAWRDVLHEGPVPASLVLEQMSDVRARFLASWDAGPFEKVREEFGARDAALRAARHVVLWFEHDLYDQLQLIQILDTLASQPDTTAEIVCIDAFPGVEPFYGLGQLSVAQLTSLWPSRRAVTEPALALGRRAWAAFTSPEPQAVRQLLAGDVSALPFLRAALERLLEESPQSPDGLSRTERQILRATAAGHDTFAAIFRANQQQEAAPFLGDTTVQQRIDALTHAPVPLLTREPIRLTDAGKQVLAGEKDARQLNGLDRWIGGRHLQG